MSEASDLVAVKYVGPLDAVELPDGQVVARGDTAEVSAETAGAPPTWADKDRTEMKVDGDGFPLAGSGLLAQHEAFEPATAKPAKAANDKDGDQ